MAGSSQCQQPPMDRSFSLDRGISFQEDKTTMTIKFLRARLLAARTDSKAARQEVHMMANKVLELEQRIDSEIWHRKKLENARLDALSAHMDKLLPEYKHLFQEDTGSSEVIDGTESAVRSKDISDQVGEEIKPTDKDKGTLTWVRRNGAKRLPSSNRFSKHKVIDSVGIEGESTKKKWAGKSVRQIRKKEIRAQAASLEEENEKIQNSYMDVDGKADHSRRNVGNEGTDADCCRDDQLEISEQFEKEKGTEIIRDEESMVGQSIEDSGMANGPKEGSVSSKHMEDVVCSICVNKACASGLHHKGLCQEDTSPTFLGGDKQCGKDVGGSGKIAPQMLSLETLKDGPMTERLILSEQTQRPSSRDSSYEELDLRPANNVHNFYSLTDGNLSPDSIVSVSKHRLTESQCSKIIPPYMHLHAAGPQYAVDFNASSLASFPGWRYATNQDGTLRHHRHTSIDASLDKVMGVLRVLEVAKQQVVEGSIGPASTPLDYYHPQLATKTAYSFERSSSFGRVMPHINGFGVARPAATGYLRSSSRGRFSVQ